MGKPQIYSTLITSADRQSFCPLDRIVSGQCDGSSSWPRRMLLQYLEMKASHTSSGGSTHGSNHVHWLIIRRHSICVSTHVDLYI